MSACTAEVGRDPRRWPLCAEPLGRKVKKGEHGIRTQNQPVLVDFRAAYVFDVSQTEGKELPEFSERVSGNAGEYQDRLMDFVIGRGTLG
jgi:hypothetical protein